jgi:hypothetical protein
VFTITVDPFKSWKRTARMLGEAKAHGYRTLVCLDDRTSEEDRAKIATLADQLIDWESDGFCEKAYQFVAEVQTPNVLLISDDELPSPALWEFAKDPPHEARWGIPVIPLIRDRYDPKMIGFQERVFATKGWRWIGGYEGHSEGAIQAYLNPNPGVIVWHYLLEAPLAERQEKAGRYAGFTGVAPTMHTDHAQRVLYEERIADLQPLPEQLRRFLPKSVN